MRYLTNIVEVDAEPMILEEAIRTGLQPGYIDCQTKDTPGYKVTYHGESSLWLPAETFQRHYLKAEEDSERAEAIKKIKECAIRKMKTEILNMEERGEERVDTVASAFLNFFLLHTDYRNTQRQCLALVSKADAVDMWDLDFTEALALMDYGFAVRNAGWRQNQYFLLKHMKGYNLCYYAKNPKFPVNPIVTKVMDELSDSYDCETPPTYYVVDMDTGKYMKWDLMVSETEGGSWEVYY